MTTCKSMSEHCTVRATKPATSPPASSATTTPLAPLDDASVPSFAQQHVVGRYSCTGAAGATWRDSIIPPGRRKCTVRGGYLWTGHVSESAPATGEKINNLH